MLLNAKPQIATEAPLAARIEAPDQEKTTPIPIHPGTVTYLDGQTSTFLERYGDWFYIGIMGLGLGGSAIAGYFSVSASRAREGVLSLLAELERLIAEARQAPDVDTLDAAEAQVDAIFSRRCGRPWRTRSTPARWRPSTSPSPRRGRGQGPAGSPGLPSLSQPSMPRAAARPGREAALQQVAAGRRLPVQHLARAEDARRAPEHQPRINSLQRTPPALEMAARSAGTRHGQRHGLDERREPPGRKPRSLAVGLLQQRRRGRRQRELLAQPVAEALALAGRRQLRAITAMPRSGLRSSRSVAKPSRSSAARKGAERA